RRRRREAFANAIAACAIACSLCARNTGRRARACSSASPIPVTLPCPKIANTPWNSGSSAPSISVRCPASQRTRACAIVRRIVFLAMPASLRRRASSSPRARTAPHADHVPVARGHRPPRGLVVAACEPALRRLREDAAADREAPAHLETRRDRQRFAQSLRLGAEPEQHHALAVRIAVLDHFAHGTPAVLR